MAHILYIGHSIHAGQDFDYEFAKNLGPLYLQLPNLYGISLVQVDGEHRQVIASILVKTELGQSKEDIGNIFAVATSDKESLKNLPKKNVTLRCTRINPEPNVIPSEADIVRLLTEVYTVNGVGGIA